MTSVQVAFVLILAIVQLCTAEYVEKGRKTILKDNLSMNPNRCHHPLITQLSHLNEAVAYDDASNPHDFIRYIPDGRMNCHIEAKNRAGIGSWHGFRDGSGDYRIDEAQWAGQGEEEKNEIRHLSDQSLEKKIHSWLLTVIFLVICIRFKEK